MSRKPVAPLVLQVAPLPITSLFVDQTYQRPTDGARAEAIVKNFDPHAFQVLEVSARDDGRFAVFDGGHRLRVGEIMGFPELLCRVHHGLTIVDEAELYNMLQSERKKLSTMDMFKADLVRQYPAALRIHDTATKHGFKLAAKKDDGTLWCLAELYAIDKLGVLAKALSYFSTAWPGYPVHRHVLHGLGTFIAAWPGELDTTVCIKMLQCPEPDRPRSPFYWGRFAERRAQEQGVKPFTACAGLFAEAYQQALRNESDDGRAELNRLLRHEGDSGFQTSILLELRKPCTPFELIYRLQKQGYTLSNLRRGDRHQGHHQSLFGALTDMGKRGLKTSEYLKGDFHTTAPRNNLPADDFWKDKRGIASAEKFDALFWFGLKLTLTDHGQEALSTEKHLPFREDSPQSPDADDDYDRAVYEASVKRHGAIG